MPAWLSFKSPNAAMPETALFVVVPVRVPAPGLVPMPIVILAVEDVTALPKLSRTLIVGGPGRLLPTVVFPGCVVKASAEAGPAEMWNALLVALVSPGEDDVKV